jgi:hypothetical protein
MSKPISKGNLESKLIVWLNVLVVDSQDGAPLEGL